MPIARSEIDALSFADRGGKKTLCRLNRSRPACNGTSRHESRAPAVRAACPINSRPNCVLRGRRCGADGLLFWRDLLFQNLLLASRKDRQHRYLTNLAVSQQLGTISSTTLNLERAEIRALRPFSRRSESVSSFFLGIFPSTSENWCYYEWM